MQRRAVDRLLTRHFLRRFLDNDLISPHIDLHENVTMICASLATTTLFLSVILSSKMLIGVPTPGTAAMLSLGDNFAFLGGSMIAMALVAAAQWDALSLDSRDTFNLGPLPIDRAAIVRAKFRALAIFAAGFAAALNVAPSLIYEAFFVAKIPVGFSGLLRLAASHALASALASAFGFLAVIAFRELLRTLIGPALFARISGSVQALLVFGLISALLLLPGVELEVFQPALPPAWFLGLAQVLNGGVIAAVTMPVPRALAGANERWLTVYRGHEAFFGEAATTGLVALAVVGVVAMAAYAWNVRRLPQPVAASGRARKGLSLLTAVFGGRHPIARAGFAFALQTIVRSASHRLSLAVAAALAITISSVLLGRIDLTRTFDPAAPPHSLLAVQTAVLIILLAGFRQAARRPAELRANWIMQVAWRGAERRFLAGVKRAAIAGIGLSTLAVLWPFHAWFVGPTVASVHFVVGLLLTVAFVEALFAGYRSAPFASSYEPAGNMKILGPLAFVGFFLFVYIFTRLERAALETADGLALLAGGLVAASAAAMIVDRWQRRGFDTTAFGDTSEPATEWLGLSS